MATPRSSNVNALLTYLHDLPDNKAEYNTFLAATGNLANQLEQGNFISNQAALEKAADEVSKQVEKHKNSFPEGQAVSQEFTVNANALRAKIESSPFKADVGDEIGALRDLANPPTRDAAQIQAQNQLAQQEAERQRIEAEKAANEPFDLGKFITELFASLFSAEGIKKLFAGLTGEEPAAAAPAAPAPAAPAAPAVQQQTVAAISPEAQAAAAAAAAGSIPPLSDATKPSMNLQPTGGQQVRG